jgi:hypothetical protein
MRALLNNRHVLGLLFMLPAGVLLLLFLTYPLGLGTWLGFTDTKVGRAGVWVGLDNFRYLVGDSVAQLSLFNTLFYTAVASVFKFALGLWLALLLNRHLPFKSLIRAVVLLPFIVPTALSAIAFWWIYDSQFSVISWALLKMGLIDRYIDFLGDPWNARLSVIAANIWRGVPFVAICLLAGLQTISPSLYGGGARRRHPLAAFPLRDAAAAHADHRGGDDVLGALHVHGLPADLRDHARRAAQCDTPHGHTLVPACDSRRVSRRGRGARHAHDPVPPGGDPFQLLRPAAAGVAAGGQGLRWTRARKARG